MGRAVAVLRLLVAVTAAFSAMAVAQSTCSSALITLFPCLEFVQGRASAPSALCCTPLGNVLKSQPECLCSLLGGGSVSANDQARALALPGACKFSAPSASLCNGATPPPPPSSPATPSTTPAPPSKSGMPSTPTPTGSGSTVSPPALGAFCALLFAVASSTMVV